MSGHSDPDHALANMFVGFGVLGTIGGAILILLAHFGWPDWSKGLSVEVDSILVGALYAVMGIGFAAFGFLLRVEDWEANESQA